MKSILGLIFTLILSQVSSAHGIGSDEAAIALKEKLSGVTLLMENVNGIGVTGCDPKTGLQSDFKNDFVYCVALSTVTDEAADALKALFPAGKKIDGVFIVVEAIGPISAQPGIKVSN